MKKSLVLGFIIFAATILGIYFSYQKYQRDHDMQGIGNYQMPTSKPISPTDIIVRKPLDLKFTKDTSPYPSYIDQISILETQLQCLDNSEPFYSREVNTDLKQLIHTVTAHKEVVETDQYKGTLSDLEEYTHFHTVCQTTRQANGVSITRSYFLFYPFYFNETAPIKKFQKSFSLIPIVYAGGGTGFPTHLAVVEKTNDNASKEISFFLSKKSIVSETTFIKQLFPNKEERYSKDMAYFTCNSIVGVSNDLVYVGCGGGDGPGSAWGLIEFNLVTMKGTEKISCIGGPSVNPQGESAHLNRCVNDKGQVLKEEFKVYPK